jgi:hypothetical protein
VILPDRAREHALEVRVQVLEPGIEGLGRQSRALEVGEGTREAGGDLGGQQPSLVQHHEMGPVHGEQGGQRGVDVGQETGTQHAVDEFANALSDPNRFSTAQGASRT